MIVGLILEGETVKAQEHIKSLREAALALDMESAALKAQVKSLEQKVELRQRLHMEGGVYWLRLGGSRNGPFCPQCYESGGKMVRLDSIPSKDLPGAFHCLTWKCKRCKASYEAI